MRTDSPLKFDRATVLLSLVFSTLQPRVWIIIVNCQNSLRALVMIKS